MLISQHFQTCKTLLITVTMSVLKQKTCLVFVRRQEKVSRAFGMVMCMGGWAVCVLVGGLMAQTLARLCTVTQRSH